MMFDPHDSPHPHPHSETLKPSSESSLGAEQRALREIELR